MADLGNKVIAGAVTGITTAYIHASHATTDGTGGTTDKIYIYAENTAAFAVHLKAAIYSHNASYDMYDRLASEVEITLGANAPAQWFSANYVAALAASTKYWLAMVLEHDACEPYFLASQPAGSQCWIAYAPYDLPAQNTAAINEYTRLFCIYATYSSAGGGAPETLRVLTSARWR